MALPATMKAWRLPNYNEDPAAAVANLNLEEIPVPADIPAGHVLVKVEYASCNPIDWKLFTGGYHGFFPVIDKENPKPYTVGFDFAGTVVKAGSGVQHLAVGDKCCGDSGLAETCKDPAPYGGPAGAFAEYIAVDAGVVAKLQPGADLRSFAALPLAGLTSWQALFTAGAKQSWKGGPLGQLSAGQAVLILGGAGGTGALAIQLAKNAGATVYATCSGAKAAFVEELGATAIDYTKQNWHEVLAGKQLDLIYDCVGKPEDYQKHAAQVLKPGGTYVTIANLMDKTEVDGVSFAPFILVSNRADLEAMVKDVEAGKLKVPIDSEFALADANKALAASLAGRARGKIVIKVA